MTRKSSKSTLNRVNSTQTARAAYTPHRPTLALGHSRQFELLPADAQNHFEFDLISRMRTDASRRTALGTDDNASSPWGQISMALLDICRNPNDQAPSEWKIEVAIRMCEADAKPSGVSDPLRTNNWKIRSDKAFVLTRP
jgi:hypothetical protein